MWTKHLPSKSLPLHLIKTVIHWVKVNKMEKGKNLETIYKFLFPYIHLLAKSVRRIAPWVGFLELQSVGNVK